METIASASLKKIITNMIISGKYEFPDAEDKVHKLSQELALGEQSQTIKNFNSHHYLQKLHEKYL